MITQGALAYLNSLELWARPIYVGNTYHVKFHCGIELARKVVVQFKARNRDLTIVHHVNKAKTHVTFGGHFHQDSGAYATILQLLKDNK